MLQRDYILRLIREFMAAIERMLRKKEIADRREEIKQLYEQYVGPYALYRNATTDEVMLALAGLDPNSAWRAWRCLPNCSMSRLTPYPFLTTNSFLRRLSHSFPS